MRRLRSLIVISVFLILTGVFPVFAADLQQQDSFLTASAEVPVIETDVTKPSDGCVIIGLSGKYIIDVQGALDRINEIRLEACKEGVRNPVTNQPLTEADYVPVKWSGDLEYIARIRAAEAALTGDHVRTNGNSWYALSSPNGVGSSSEVLAWYWPQSMVYGIDVWYEEKADWVNQTAGKVTGHYTAMINPRNLYVGLGTFNTAYACYPTTTAGEFSRVKSLDETPTGTAGECVQLLELNGDYLQSTPVISGDVPETVGEETQLSLLANITGFEPSIQATIEGVPVLRGVTWSSDAPAVASVSESGLLRGLACGETSIHAEAAGTSAEIAYAVPHAYGDWVTTKEATCEEDGHRERVCSSCQDKIEETIPATGHDWDDGQITAAPTCTEEGTKTYTCRTCGSTRTEILQPTSHQWNDTHTVDKEPTCTEAGSRSIHCFVCGEIQEGSVEEIPAAGHTFGEWEVIGSPTCGDQGAEQRVCSVCGAVETKNIDPAGHDWVAEYTVDKEPTCTEEGSKSIHCMRCGVADPSSVTVIPALGHSWDEGEIIKPVTCTEDGEKKYTCLTCGETRTETVTAGHQWNSEYTVDKEATCTEAGSQSIHCSVCDEIQEGSVMEIPKAEHTWGEDVVIDRAPTCTESGSHSIHCTVCDAVKEGSEATIPALGHAWDAGVVTREATIEEDGERTFTCERCGETRTEIIPAIGKEPADYTAVNELKKRAEALDPTLYTPGSYAAVMAAVEAVEEGKMIGEQPEVDAMAKAIEDAIDGLVKLFDDVKDPNRYFFTPVYWAVDRGITVGYGKGTFSPYVNCTREQIVSFLWRMEEKPGSSHSRSFTDVKPTDWYYEAVCWAAENGITVGLNDGTGRFGVGQPCTREMCVSFLWRLEKYKNAGIEPEGSDAEQFTDVTDPGRYFYKPIYWAAENGITVGLNDGTGRFGVGMNVTRGQMVSFLYRYDN